MDGEKLGITKVLQILNSHCHSEPQVSEVKNLIKLRSPRFLRMTKV